MSTAVFSESLLHTKYATFQVRVYRDQAGKEHMILWTEHLDTSAPVLVRVHSECLTGDTLGSLHCDCGQQLARALQVISEEGGALLYLRQEGRGIGLLEKMKSYKLQSDGYDTVEANVLLGHQPDLRTYEMVQLMLRDLHITRIRLLTNNPSKISEISQLGIEVTERVPLIPKPHKHSKKYVDTKRKKFQHFTEKDHHYFFQFHVDTPEQFTEIADFLRHQKRDMLLDICVGISADRTVLRNQGERERIASIIDACYRETSYIPVLHFSFLHSTNVLTEVEEIKRIWPTLTRIQLNDLGTIDIPSLEKIHELFHIDMPISDTNFGLIHEPRFRKLVKKYHSCILLDNSKGRGITETEVAYKQKIDLLLAYGLNNIGLCGGFGPYALDVYMALKHFYKINFSIDAESKLKSRGRVDLVKTKLYLSQLLYMQETEPSNIVQTKQFLAAQHREEWEEVEIESRLFAVHPSVFPPGRFPSTAWYAQELCALVQGEHDFCEIGCGAGVITTLVALTHPQMRLVATDINPDACHNTIRNAERWGCRERICIVQGDVLDAIPPESAFDTIFWALPFVYLEAGRNIDMEEAQVFDPGYRALHKFFQQGKSYLKPGGRLLFAFSTDLGNTSRMEELAIEAGVMIAPLRQIVLRETESVLFQLYEGRKNR